MGIFLTGTRALAVNILQKKEKAPHGEEPKGEDRFI